MSSNSTSFTGFSIRTFVGALFVLALMTVLWWSQGQLAPYEARRHFAAGGEESIATTGKHLHPFLAGFTTFAADVFWLQAVQYVGANMELRDFPALEGYLTTITDLDPKFAYAYHFGGVLLPATGKYEAAVSLLQKAEKNLPELWQPSYDLGFVFFYYLDNYNAAIAAYERCLQKTDCLPAAKTVVATLRAKTGKVEIALQNLLQEFQNATPTEANFLLQKIEEVGKLFLLQKTAALHPPHEKITELFGAKIPQTPELQRILPLLQKIIGKTLVSAQGTLLPEAFQSPFRNNPYFWDVARQEIRPMRW